MFSVNLKPGLLIFLVVILSFIVILIAAPYFIAAQTGTPDSTVTPTPPPTPRPPTTSTSTTSTYTCTTKDLEQEFTARWGIPETTLIGPYECENYADLRKLIDNFVQALNGGNRPFNFCTGTCQSGKCQPTDVKPISGNGVIFSPVEITDPEDENKKLCYLQVKIAKGTKVKLKFTCNCR